MEDMSKLIFEPFIISDHRCTEFDQLISSKDYVDIEHYSQILVYLDRCYEKVKEFFTASVFLDREFCPGNPRPVMAIESSFCLSLRKHAWIPVVNGGFYKPADVYYLSMNNPFRRYLPCVDSSKIALTNQNFVKLLEMQVEVQPVKMFELFMKWSCNLDSDTLWNLIKTYSHSNENE